MSSLRSGDPADQPTIGDAAATDAATSNGGTAGISDQAFETNVGTASPTVAARLRILRSKIVMLHCDWKRNKPIERETLDDLASQHCELYSQSVTHLKTEKEAETAERRFLTYDQHITDMMSSQTQASSSTQSAPLISPAPSSNITVQPITTENMQLHAVPSTGNTQHGSITARTHYQSPANSEPYQLPLKAVQLPMFTGEQKAYYRFRQIWFATIHQSNMSKANKFLHVVQSLSGSQFDRYFMMVPSDESYDQLVADLEQRYLDRDHQQTLIFREVAQLPNLRPNSEVNVVYDFVCKVEALYEQASRIGMSDEYLRYQLKYQLIEKCSPDIKLKAANNKVGSVKDLLSVLQEHVQTLRELEKYRLRGTINNTVALPSTSQATTGRSGTQSRVARVNVVADGSSAPQQRTLPMCVFCDERHLYRNCPRSVDEKEHIVSEKRLCRVCFKSGHLATNCERKLKACRLCTRTGHSSFLCRASPTSNTTGSTSVSTNIKSVTTPAEKRETVTTSNPIHVNTCVVGHKSFYKTLIARINGQPVRMLIDEASGRSFISASLVKRLGIKTEAAKPLPIAVFMQEQPAMTSDSIARTTLSSLDNSFTMPFNARVVPSIGDASFDCLDDNLSAELHRHGIVHNDSAKGPVEVIIGFHRARSIATSTPPLEFSGNLTAAKTSIGWVVYGGFDEDHDDSNHAQLSPAICSTFLINMKELYNELDKPQPDDDTVSEFVQNFSKKIEFDGERFTVPLPWLKPTQLANNYNIAAKRLQSTTASIRRNGLLDEYSNKMAELVAKDYVEEVAATSPIPSSVNYLPHHPVLRPDKESSKLRIVFDGSAKNAKGQALNSRLMKGTTTWNLFGSMVDVRRYQWAITADLAEAFLSVSVNERDRDVLRYLWYRPDGQIAQYRFKRVPFGTSASPFLLYQAMQALFDRCPIEQEVVKQIRSCFYVDDLCISLANSNELSYFKTACENILKTGSMILRRFRTNHDIDRSWCPDGRNQLKLLGTNWDLRSDLFSPMLPSYPAKLTTKRDIASLLASFFDPLGIALPYYLRFKFILQSAWIETREWESPLSPSLQRQASADLSHLPDLESVRVPRWIGCSPIIPTVLHLFVDASDRALGAVLYAAQPNQHRSAFLCSRNKLVQPKCLTTPALELKAAQFGAELLANVAQRLNISRAASSIKSLNSLDHRIAPRVWSVRQKLMNLKYEVKHVRTEYNPADLLTRGCDPNRLTSDDWRLGPVFIREHVFNPTPVLLISDAHQRHQVAPELEALLRNGNASQSSIESIVEGTDATERLMNLLKASQQVWFRNEIAAVLRRELVSRSSLLRNYQLFVDDDGILRLFSRLARNEDLSYDRRFPVVLAPDCSLTQALIMETHEFNGHGSCTTTDNALLERYFIPGHRRVVKRTLKRCGQCQVVKGNQLTTPLAPLPAWKSTPPSRPFLHTFIDIFGPLHVKITPPRVFYGIIYVCGHTRAVHLELIPGQDADSVLLAFRSFCARRGTPHHVYSDNGPGLKRAQSILHDYFRQLKSLPSAPELSRRGISWNFASPYSPWKLGQHERLIRTVKEAFRGMTFKRQLTHAQLNTLFGEVEQLVNSRPLYRDENGAVITPADYIGIGPRSHLPPLTPSAPVGSPELLNIKRFHRRLNGLWSKWLTSFLAQGPNIYRNPVGADPPLAIGDLVLVDDAKRDRADWPLGTVEKIYYSGDQFPRSADVKLSSGRILTNRSTRRFIRIPGPPSIVDNDARSPGGEDVTDGP